jgi:homoserine/homoserine lactone efflux protein
MPLETWLAFCLTETVLCFSPGPAVLLVVSVALSRGLRPGVAASLGILGANTLYFALSAAGVGAALIASRELFLAIKWAGAAYLIWLGLRMLLSRARPGRGEPAPAAAPRSFFRGFVVQGANPKALVFFTALLPQFIDPAAPIAKQVLILGVSSVLIEFGALTVYVLTAVRGRRLAGAYLAGPIERVGGAFLVAAGVRLAAVRHG